MASFNPIIDGFLTKLFVNDFLNDDFSLQYMIF